MKVITYQSDNGTRIDICKPCRDSPPDKWPRDSRGAEFASVYHGLHNGPRCEAVWHELRERRAVGRPSQGEAALSVPIGLRLTAGDTARLDTVREDMTRGEYVRVVLLEHLAGA